jgi:hypothetical protein
MTEEQLKEWFWDKFNSCYYVKHDDYPDSIFMVYDINFIRSKKLANILDKEVEYPTVVNGDCLFRQNYKTNMLWCDRDKIWSFLETNYINNYKLIKELIKGWLEEYAKSNVLKPDYSYLSSGLTLKEYNKLSVLTPNSQIIYRSYSFGEQDKLKVLTPNGHFFLNEYLHDEHKIRIN